LQATEVSAFILAICQTRVYSHIEVGFDLGSAVKGMGKIDT